jgi:hypothetical protein
MAGETEPTVPSAVHRGDGETRRGTPKRMLTEKGQTYSLKPKTRRLNKDSPAVHPRKVSSRASKSYRMDNFAKRRSSGPRASQIGENDQLGTLSCSLVTSHASCCIKLVVSELIPGVVTPHCVLQMHLHR